MASTSHLCLVSAREGKFLVSFASSNYERQLTGKLIAKAYFTIKDNCLASDCFVTYGPVSMKLINLFKIDGTDPA